MGILKCLTGKGSVLGLVLLLLSGCATQLAPLYDKALMDGLTAVNSSAMELLASAEGGTDKAGFGTREPGYNQLIGRFDALSLQSAARPVPSNDVLADVRKIAGDKTGQAPAIPSATALNKLARTFAMMRDTDKAQGLTPLEVKAFRGQVVIYLDQALTYEAALKR
ncbi:hypothetical protein PVT67_07790 [Gallaecimonas kandeliae]|uniref:hypothetical protein n=1 Tax=Gallaecimonas kandeliae TaxID=3029055 RepID=UPI0026493597|nr:hypothetical protein [Gallaecimonas kandeliae]WKE67126.1 hypothetical protein PVT67_07790 [Gallaecimonas kandeliae]